MTSKIRVTNVTSPLRSRPPQKVGLKNVERRERHSGIVLRTVLFVCCFFVDAAPTAFQKTQRRIDNRWLLPFHCKAVPSASTFFCFPDCYAPDRQRTGNDLKSALAALFPTFFFFFFLQEVSARACWHASEKQPLLPGATQI